MDNVDSQTQVDRFAAETLRFNLEPLSDIDDSWTEVLPFEDLYRAGLAIPAATPWLSRYVLDEQEVATRYWCDFSVQRARLALMDRETLQGVCLYVGLALKGPEIRNQVDGAFVKNLRSAVGPEAVDFVFRTAPLLGEPPSVLIKQDDKVDLRAAYILLGALYSTYGPALKDDAYVKRLVLKLPQSIAEAFYIQSHQPQWRNADPETPAFVMRIIKEAAPQCLPLFN